MASTLRDRQKKGGEKPMLCNPKDGKEPLRFQYQPVDSLQKADSVVGGGNLEFYQRALPKEKQGCALILPRRPAPDCRRMEGKEY